MGNFCYRCMLPTVRDGVCTRCGELEAACSNNGENALSPGTVLGKGRLTVGKKLGSGGFGVTYIAYDNKLKRRVALKEFMPNYLAVRQGKEIVPKKGQNDPYQKAMNSFMKEARTLYELRAHPNIVHVISVFKENNTAYYTMEMLEGESLLNYLRRKKKISANRAFQMLLPIMRAIQYVHSKKMIHRDISPDNIMLCEDPSRPGSVVPKLIDFGAAHVAIEGYSLSYPGVKKNGFSPLEQNWEGHSQGPWTDVYSFCATFYSAIVGNVPVSAQARSEADRDPLKLPRELGADIIPEMQDVLMRGLKIQYADRIQTMDQLIREMSGAVESSQNSTVVEIARQAEPEPTRPVARRIFAWLLEIALLGGGVFLLRGGSLFRQFGLEGDPTVLALLIVPGLLFLLDLVLLVSAGSTIGQLLFGLKTREEDGEGTPNFGSALAYSLLYASYGFPVAMICGLIWLASGKNIGPLESLTGVTVGLRRQEPVHAYGLSGIVSRGVSVPGTPPKPENSRPAVPAKEESKPAPREEGKLASSGHGQVSVPKQKPAFEQKSVPERTPPAEKAPSREPRPKSEPAPGENVSAGKAEPGPGSRPATPVSGTLKNAPTARLVCLKAGETAAAVQGKAVTVRDGARLGKNPQKSGIVIPDKTVSGLHCSFHYVQGKGWMIRDEESTNGTYINSVRLSSGGFSPLKNGTQIITGKETFEFKC